MSKPLVWLSGEVKTPPFSDAARIEAGFLLRRLQEGEALGMPQSRPMPIIGDRCHELRVRDEDVAWRIFYHAASDAIVILGVEKKSRGTTSQATIRRCSARLWRYVEAEGE